MELIAKTLYGLEPVLATELKQLGAQHIKELNRAVSFEGDQALLYKANLWCRTALKILVPISNFRARDEEFLYRGIKRIRWENYLDVADTFAIDAKVHSDHFNHSKYVALKCKDAIVDRFREQKGNRPSVDVEDPALRIHIHVSRDRVSVSLDSSGAPLYKRGYRTNGRIAPINESLAAGMLLLAGYSGEKPFLDPMCGSGTLPIEAALIAKNRAPGMLRDFGFMDWNDFDRDLWEEIRDEALQNERQAAQPILGRDHSYRAVESAEDHAHNAGVADLVTFEKGKLEDYSPGFEGGLMVCNPPYGERLEVDDLGELYGMMGTRMKHHFAGWTVWLISSDFKALKSVGLRTSSKKVVFNGSLECKLHQYELYSGSRKAKKQPIA